jgi:hypothetical protein
LFDAIEAEFKRTFGDENITPIVDFLLNYTGTLPEAASTVDPSAFADLLSSIGL